jgi:hypothetical protein
MRETKELALPLSGVSLDEAIDQCHQAEQHEDLHARGHEFSRRLVKIVGFGWAVLDHEFAVCAVMATLSVCKLLIQKQSTQQA